MTAVFDVIRKKDELSIRIESSLSGSDHDAFVENVLKPSLSDAVVAVHIHLDKLDFIDSAGIGFLLLLHDRAEAQQPPKPIMLYNPKGEVEKLFSLARLDTKFAVVKDITEPRP